MERTKLFYGPAVRRRKFKVDEMASVVGFGKYHVSCGTQIDQVQLVPRLKGLFSIDGGALSPDPLQVRYRAVPISLDGDQMGTEKLLICVHEIKMGQEI